MRSWGATAGVLLALGACRADRPSAEVPLSGPPLLVPPLEPTADVSWSAPPEPPSPAHCRPDTDEVREAHALAAREHSRAMANGSGVLRAHVLEAIPRLLVEDKTLPPVKADFVDRVSRWPRSGGKVVFSRELVGRVRALARVHDADGPSATALVDLANLSEANLSTYIPSPDEPSPAPGKSVVRRAALAALGRGGLRRTPPAVRSFLQTNISSPRDDVEAWLLAPAAAEHLRAGNAVFFRQWIAELKQRLRGAAAPLSAEIIIDRRFVLGVEADRFVLKDEVRAVIDEIVKTKGSVPVTRGSVEKSRALYVAAVAAAFDLDDPWRGHDRTPRLYFGPPDTTVALSTRTLLDTELPRRVREATRTGRLTEVEGEQKAARFPLGRCYLWRELAFATSAPSAHTRFEELIQPVFSGPRVDLTDHDESLCRLRTALEMPDVAEEERIAARCASWRRRSRS
jgi:hypothetical protein